MFSNKNGDYYNMNIFNVYKEGYNARKAEEMTMGEFLTLCKNDPSVYATSAERILKAIGEPVYVDTSSDPRLSRIFSNRTIKTYKPFTEFFGMEDVIENVVSFFKHAAQGLEESKQILYLLGPVGGGKCLSKGTKIAMADGSLKNIEDVRIGDMVLSHNDGLKTFKKVTNTFIIEPKKALKVKTRRGFEITGASTHRLFTEQGWTRIDELQSGKYIALANEQIFGSDSQDENELKLLAFLLGDGNIATCKNKVQFCCFNDEIYTDFKIAMDNMGILISRHSPGHYTFTGDNKIPFFNKLKEWGVWGKYSYEKTIPDFVFSLNKEQLSLFLNRLFSTDGWATVETYYSRPREDGRFHTKSTIGYCSTSKKMILQIQQLLMKYGIISNICEKQGKYNDVVCRTAYTLSICGSDSVVKFADTIGIIGKKSAVDAVKQASLETSKIGTSGRVIPKNIAAEAVRQVNCHKYDGTSKIKYMIRTTLDGQKTVAYDLVKKLCKLVENPGEDLQFLLEQNYFWDKIESVEYTGDEEVMYDFEVESHHNYVANGFISHNSTLAEKLKSLVEQQPIYVIKGSPIHESPLWLFDVEHHGQFLKEEYGIDSRYIKTVMSPWAAKKLEEFGGDVTKFKVQKIWPSRLLQVGVTKTEPGDENNQDISSLVGKVDIRKLEDFSQDDPYAYNYCGGLNVTTQGMLEFVEMFKAPIKMLHPLLTATQEGNYNGTESFGAMPYQGVILAHSNLAEWETFRNDKKNEAFIDRVYLVKVPYCLRLDEEIKIYRKLIENSDLRNSICAPGTLDLLAQFSILTRLKEPENSNIYSKMRVYNGENLKDTDPKAKSLQEYKDFAGVDEGMDGLSTRFAYKILSKVFNFDSEEVSANPVHLMYVLEQQITQEQFSKDVEDRYVEYIKGYLQPKYAEFIGDEIQKAYVESYDEYGQNMFERYIEYADHWIQDKDYRDNDTGQIFDRDVLNQELEKMEKPCGIANPKSFRSESVNFTLRARSANNGKPVDWKSYEKMRRVIEKRMFSQVADLLPVISFGSKKSNDERKKHEEFVSRMRKNGYTDKMIKLLVEWFIRYRNNN